MGICINLGSRWFRSILLPSVLILGSYLSNKANFKSFGLHLPIQLSLWSQAIQTVQNSHFSTRFWSSIFSIIRWTLELSNPLFEILLECTESPAKNFEVKSLVEGSSTSKFPRDAVWWQQIYPFLFQGVTFKRLGIWSCKRPW